MVRRRGMAAKRAGRRKDCHGTGLVPKSALLCWQSLSSVADAYAVCLGKAVTLQLLPPLHPTPTRQRHNLCCGWAGLSCWDLDILCNRLDI